MVISAIPTAIRKQARSWGDSLILPSRKELSTHQVGKKILFFSGAQSVLGRPKGSRNRRGQVVDMITRSSWTINVTGWKKATPDICITKWAVTFLKCPWELYKSQHTRARTRIQIQTEDTTRHLYVWPRLCCPHTFHIILLSRATSIFFGFRPSFCIFLWQKRSFGIYFGVSCLIYFVIQR